MFWKSSPQLTKCKRHILGSVLPYNNIDICKLLLILAVVLIHSDFLGEYDDVAPLGALFIKWLCQSIAGCAVPTFFIISGYLFFKGLVRFSPEVYLSKLRRRCHTLLIPYLIWNIIALVLLWVKWYCFHMPGLGVFTNDGINLTALLKGFWITSAGYPFEFAFWFIRNLIVFVVLSPLAWWMSRNLWMVAIALAFNIYGFEYFLLGAFIARRGETLRSEHPATSIAVTLFLLTTVLLTVFSFNDWAEHCLRVLRNLSGAVTFILIATLLSHTKFGDSTIGRSLVKSTFFIYAIHSLYCMVLRDFVADIIGVDTTLKAMASLIFSWLLLVASSYTSYLILQRWSPKTTAVLSGGRS